MLNEVWDEAVFLVGCADLTPRSVCTLFIFHFPGGLEGGENYPITPAIIALCMAAVNMDAGVCAAVGRQVLMQMKWGCVCVCHITFPVISNFVSVRVSGVPAG